MRLYHLRSALRNQAEETARILSAEYVRRVGKEKFPRNLDVMMDVAQVLFGLDVVFDEEGTLNDKFGEDDLIIGCLFPDGHPSPWGRDKIVAVNMTGPRCCREAEPRLAELNRQKRERGESGVMIHCCNKVHPAHFNQNHTIAHEVIGHYAIHHKKTETVSPTSRPVYCRNPQSTKKPLKEWQADLAAGEFLMPPDKVAWILDGQKPGAMINMTSDVKKRFREFFDASQAMMEIRLLYLGYKMINPTYEWADHAKLQAKKDAQVQKNIQRKAEAQKYIDELMRTRAQFNDALGKGNPFTDAFKGMDDIFKGFGGFDIFGGPPKRSR